MTLLELERVSKRYRRGSRVALDDVLLTIDAGEMVVIWGERQSGRSTLLRIAAGVETPDAGVVRFAGHELTPRNAEKFGEEISYVRRHLRSQWGRTVLDELVAVRLAQKATRPAAVQDAWKALKRVEAEHCAMLEPVELKTEETLRVVIARALLSSPRLIVIDEPTIGVHTLKQDDILDLMRSLANEGVAILATTGTGIDFLGADRVLALDSGRLIGEREPELAPVTELDDHRRRARG